MLTETDKLVLFVFCIAGFFFFCGYILAGIQKSITIYKISFCLGAVFGQTVACSDRQDGVVATSPVGTEDGNAEGLCLHCGTTHTLLLYSSSLQGVH